MSKAKQMVQKGFTLIELVVVILIIAILAAVAVPKFLNLQSDARTAALSGIVGQIESGSAINYAGRKANASNGTAIVVTTSACGTVVPALLASGAMPSGYTTTGNVASASSTVGTCTITQTSGGATDTVDLLLIS